MVYRMKQVTSFRPPADSEKTGLSLLVLEIISLGQQSGELRGDLDVDLLAGLFEYALIAASSRSTCSRRPMTRINPSGRAWTCS